MSTEEWEVLTAASIMLHKEANRVLAVRGLTVSQASVLGALGSAGRPLPISEIGRTLIQESQSTTTLIDRMCARGLVERTKDPGNRHLVLVRLTDEGERMFEMLLPSLPAFAEEMFSVLSPEERATLAKLLQELVERNSRRLS